jgi:hypothetical protein
MIEKTKSHGCLRIPGSLYTMFQLNRCTNSHDAQEKLKNLYWTTDEVRGYQFDNELMSLDPNYFDNIWDYVTKVNDQRAQCKSCGIEKRDIQLVLTTL